MHAKNTGNATPMNDTPQHISAHANSQAANTGPAYIFVINTIIAIIAMIFFIFFF